MAPGDRVLCLAIPELSRLEQISAAIEHGVLVCIGDRDQVAEGRRAAVHLENVMFVPATLDEIPWQEGYFNHILDPAGGWEPTPFICREIARVLAPGGTAALAFPENEPFLQAGLHLREGGLLTKP
ncbi:MAG: hypothetical protein FJW20_23285 [Acidimicrobiia bacterium]|nr:hypothetical protein [Acidimicrobiia bacterium]